MWKILRTLSYHATLFRHTCHTRLSQSYIIWSTHSHPKWDLIDSLAILLSRHWSIMRNPTYGYHAEDFLTNLKMCAITHSVFYTIRCNIIDKCTSFIDEELYARVYVFLLYASLRLASVCDVPVRITMPRSISLWSTCLDLILWENMWQGVWYYRGNKSIFEIARDVCSMPSFPSRRAS